MRVTILAGLVGAGLAFVSLPAEAAWKSYISKPLGFSFEAPGEMKTEKGTYEGALAGKKEAIVYRAVDDNIEYKAMVVDFSQRAAEGAVLLGEATFLFQDKKKLMMDTFGRVDGLYGRKLSVDQPNNGGRTLAAFYFINGRLISLQVTVLPANGDYGTPDMGRFVDSIAFRPDRAEKGSTELALPK
ncbi:MAG TPA: hypothetical protein VNH44_14415 [Micropepsaceae bacterium]|nr:hypothetical protein [Micropepsaceae bacterium]